MDHGAEITLPLPVLRLLKKGVRIPAPFSVDIGEEVDPRRISGEGVVLARGTRLSGAKTLICAGTKLGSEAPVTVDNCQLGRGVELKGGFFAASVFFDKANMASGARVREGCILEEEANGSHTVGLKQTILFPFVTLGSLINFCDCLLAGGTSRENHSEVGSSYIHFNYTPNQDKATASLLGDVARGVMLREPPIFLGGQGGLVGPARIGFGTVIAAGTVWRRDCPEGGMLLRGEEAPAAAETFHHGLYGDIRRRVTNNVHYLANLLALRQWYLHVRFLFGDPETGEGLVRGALETLERAIAERLTRLGTLAQKMKTAQGLAERFLPEENRTMILSQQRQFHDRWPELETSLAEMGKAEEAGREARDQFLGKMTAARACQGDDYLRVIRSLDQSTRSSGTAWLQEVADAAFERAFAHIPACRA